MTLPTSPNALTPRPRPETIVRQRLLDLLDEARRSPLVVVRAPAGYGKTTALVTWLASVDGEAAWVSLDATDNDPRTLCAHLISALEGALPREMADARQLLDGGARLIEVVVPAILETIAEHADRPLVIVLDDYHLIETDDCHAVVTALVDALPPSACVVLASRTTPPLRIPRRRALGTVSELGTNELAFQHGESELLLNEAFGLGLERDAVSAVEARSEGWPAGLALIASSVANQADRSAYVRDLGSRQGLSRTGIADFLIEEVLEQVTPKVRDFLCRTSILGRLCGPLCAAVLDDDSADDTLADVHASNLFVTVLDERGGVEWLRYHHLFAELLERELRARSPELVGVLHLRAAEWFEASGMYEEAITHASLAGDGRRAAGTLWGCWRELMMQWRFVTVRRLIAQMPEDRGELGGFCEALDTVCWALEGADARLVSERLDSLEPLRDAPGVAPIVDRSRISPFYGDVGRAARDGWAAWERYPDPAFRTETSAQFGQVLWFAGDPDAARSIIEPYLHELKGQVARSWAFGTLSFIATDEGDVDAAERYGRQAVDSTSVRVGAGARETAFAHTALAEALRVQGRLEEAAHQLECARQLTMRQPTSFTHAFTLVFEAHLALARGARADARAKAVEARSVLGKHPDPGILDQRLAEVETMLEVGQDDVVQGSEPTAAELRVLELLPSELTVKQIAAALHLSEKTVGAHRRRLYRRLGASTRQDAVLIARQRGLLPDTT
jgi:LuxR family maltose regulon positive regulatory protein